MTREEINILQDIVDIYEKEDMYPTLDDKQVRTIKKAIKALEPCSNCYNGNQIEKAKLCQKSYLAGMEYKWIPVSKRLPEDAQKILYSTKTGQVYSGVYFDDESENSWYSIRNGCNEYNDLVTAWMPFPKPYTAESKDDRYGYMHYCPNCGAKMAESVSKKEKLKAEVNGYFYGLNAAGKIDWSTYSTLYDVCISIIEKHYDRMEKGRRAESEKEMNNKRAVTTEKDQKIGKWRYDGKTLICSICNTWFHITDRTTYMRRCPYCGAKMESEETTE